MSCPSCSLSPARCLPCVTLPPTHPHWELNGHFPPLLLLLLGVCVFEQKGNLVGQRSVSSAMSLPCLSFLYLRLSHDRFGQRQFPSPGYLDTLHPLSTAHPTTNRLLLGLSLLCSPRRQLSLDPSSLAPKDRGFSGVPSHHLTHLGARPSPRGQPGSSQLERPPSSAVPGGPGVASVEQTTKTCGLRRLRRLSEGVEVVCPSDSASFPPF